MDVKRFSAIGFAVAFILMFTACSNKTSSSVYNSDSYASATCSGQAMENKFIVEWEDGRITVEHGKDLEDFKTTFVEPNLANIKLFEHDRKIKALHSEVTASAVNTDTWGQDMVQASALWNQGIYGQGVLVGVVDAYVDINHPQILPNIAVNSADIYGNGIDDDGNGIVDDTYGAKFLSYPDKGTTVNDHGTHVSGIVVAQHNASPGSIKGMAPQAKLIPAQFINNDGGGSIGDGILALQYVAKRGAKVINASWGGPSCLLTLRNQVEALNNQGILLVVAAGNDGKDIDYYPDFPAAFDFPNQLTVAAAGMTDFMTAWSNKGFKLVHLAAPGDDIMSTFVGNKTGSMSGTSMAAPFVTGAAALLWSAKPQASMNQIRQAILESVDVTSGHEYKVSTRGRLNVQKALARLRQLVP